MTDGDFEPTSLSQSWAKPSKPRPIVIFGAGSIVG
ncbi:MAG: gfo/Idh/MocA family oxidoreductase, partial [Mesorhizobium sp.]